MERNAVLCGNEVLAFIHRGKTYNVLARTKGYKRYGQTKTITIPNMLHTSLVAEIEQYHNKQLDINTEQNNIKVFLAAIQLQTTHIDDVLKILPNALASVVQSATVYAAKQSTEETLNHAMDPAKLNTFIIANEANIDMIRTRLTINLIDIY